MANVTMTITLSSIFIAVVVIFITWRHRCSTEGAWKCSCWNESGKREGTDDSETEEESLKETGSVRKEEAITGRRRWFSALSFSTFQNFRECKK